MKKALPIQKGVFALLLALCLGMGTTYAYDFSAVCSGKTLYFNVTDATNHYVEITCPGDPDEEDPWAGYTQPTGNITLPSSVTYNNVTYAVKAIGFAAFDGCSGMTGSLTIPNSVTLIDGWAFSNCTGFTGLLSIPNSVTSIGYGAFSGCSGFTGSLTIPNSVTEIVDNAFEYCSGFTGSLIIGNSVTTIGWEAFYGCTNFSSMTVRPETPPSLGSLVFYNVPHTIPVYVPCASLAAYQAAPQWDDFINYQCMDYDFSAVCATGQTLYYNIIDANNHYVEITYPGTSTSSPWEGYTQPTGNITLPSNVTHNNVTYVVKAIGDVALYGCSGLTGSLTIPNSVTEIGEGAFAQCSGFNGSLSIGNSVTTIGLAAFQYCHFTGSLIVPNSVITIGNGAFRACTGFTGSLTLGSSVTTIGTFAFSGCTGFSGSLNLPNSVTTIGMNAFQYCTGFTGSLTIGNSVTSIGREAFSGCTGFTGSLTIGNSVTTINNYAFQQCSGFTSMIVFPETPPTLESWVFSGVPKTIPVYVPCPSLEDYQSASVWSQFTDMQCREALTVYEGTSTSRYVPAYIYYFDDFTRSQFVIPYYDLSDMLNTSISSMTFYTTSNNVPYTTTCSADVYLKEVGYTTISAFEPKSSATIVYSGTLSIVSTGNGGEMTINFSTPYTYNGGSLLVGIENTERGGYKNIYFYGQTVNGASISDYNSSGLGNVQPTQRNFIPKTTFGYTPSECSRPIDLNETDITISSATLQWTGYQDSYDLRYRKKPLFFEDFENGLPSGWTTIDNDGDGYDWHSESNYSSSFCHSGNGIMVSASYIYEDNTNIALTPDNWLITPLLDLQGTMKVWIRAYHTNYAQEHFAIYLSTTGNSVSEFTTVLVPETTLTNTVYHAYTADLSAYAGQQGYIAIRHFNCTDMYELLVDDFGLFEDPNGTDGWETLSDIGSGYTLTALEPETEYEWQVRGRDCDGEGSYTEWSAVHVFTTEALCAPEDQCELTFTLTDSYGDGWNGAAIRVVDVETNSVLATMTNVTNDHANAPITETYTLAVCDGRALRFEWVSGYYNGECSFTIATNDGTIILEVDNGYGINTGDVLATHVVNCDGGQTVALSAGWNWFSTNVEITLEDLQTALVAALPGTTISINSQGDGSTTYNGVRWRGTLTSLDLSQMYMISVTANSEITLEGMPVNPFGHPITIHPDFNWMAFPLGQSMTLTDAFAGFVISGDMVISQDGGSSTYTNRWRGTLDALEPGKGYMYKSAATSGHRTFTFPANK